MPEYKLKLTEEQKNKLKEMAFEDGKTIQDYIIAKLDLQDIKTNIFTGEVAFQRAIEHKEELKKEPYFEVRDLYTNEEFRGINRGKAGALGRSFYVQVTKHPEIIEYIDGGIKGQRARYKFI